MPSIENEDIEKLQRFVRDVYLWLKACYIGQKPSDLPRRWPLIRLPPELARKGREAWDEFERDHPLEHFMTRIAAPSARDALVAHGLYGNQLVYKLELVEYVAERSSVWKRWRDKFIDVLDIIIDSLEPTGIAGALKELKDALRACSPSDDA
jgi:hypothetical protein